MAGKTIQELAYLGQIVNLRIDRPLHSKHPKYGFNYELNYGFIPDTIGGDGEEIDAYVIGELVSLQNFTGMVKAIIIRHDDSENKLVVAKANYSLDKDEIV